MGTASQARRARRRTALASQASVRGTQKRPGNVLSRGNALRGVSATGARTPRFAAPRVSVRSAARSAAPASAAGTTASAWAGRSCSAHNCECRSGWEADCSTCCRQCLGVCHSLILCGAVLLKIGEAWSLDGLVMLYDPCCAAIHGWRALSRVRHSVLRRRVVSRYHIGSCKACIHEMYSFVSFARALRSVVVERNAPARIGDKAHSVGVGVPFFGHAPRLPRTLIHKSAITA